MQFVQPDRRHNYRQTEGKVSVSVIIMSSPASLLCLSPQHKEPNSHQQTAIGAMQYLLRSHWSTAWPPTHTAQCTVWAPPDSAMSHWSYSLGTHRHLNESLKLQFGYQQTVQWVTEVSLGTHRQCSEPLKLQFGHPQTVQWATEVTVWAPTDSAVSQWS